MTLMLTFFWLVVFALLCVPAFLVLTSHDMSAAARSRCRKLTLYCGLVVIACFALSGTNASELLSVIALLAALVSWTMGTVIFAAGGRLQLADTPARNMPAASPEDYAELSETPRVRQIEGEPHRRWFSSVALDLIVWCDETGAPRAFQFCYDKPNRERALTWRPESGYRHEAVDDGEAAGAANYKGTPILVADGHFDARRAAQLFERASKRMPVDIVQFVAGKIRQHPNFAAGGNAPGGGNLSPAV